jgi:signal transduction histidine kinase
MKDNKQRHEQKIEALLQYANNIIATLREPFLVLNRNLQVISANNAFYATFRVVEKETMGRLLPDLGNKQWDIPKLLLLLKEILPEKKAVTDYEVEHTFEQIGERTMVLNACQVRVPKKIAGIIAAGVGGGAREESVGGGEEEELILLAIEDITERKQAEEALQKSQSLLVQAEKMGKLGGWEFDIETKQQTWTETVYEIHEMDITCRQTVDQGINFYTPASRPIIERAVQRAIEQGEPFDVELEIITAKGNLRSVHAIGKADLARRKVSGFFQDITERKKIEEEIRNLNKELENRVEQRTAELAASNKDLEAFSYSVAHDLRAPLRAIAGFANILSEDYRTKLDDEGRRLIGVISGNVIRMGQLINDLLSLSHLSRQEMEAADIDMTELARTVCNELKEDLSCDRVIEVSVKPLSAACADHTLTKQIFTNLISNAMKFTSNKDKALIEIGGYDDGQRRVYYVKDNGAGFDMKYSDKLFGVFQRLHADGEFSGTGIGLAIVSNAVRRHGGTVWAEGEIDKGATFYFTLPKGGRNEQS